MECLKLHCRGQLIEADSKTLKCDTCNRRFLKREWMNNAKKNN